MTNRQKRARLRLLKEQYGNSVKRMPTKTGRGWRMRPRPGDNDVVSATEAAALLRPVLKEAADALDDLKDAVERADWGAIFAAPSSSRRGTFNRKTGFTTPRTKPLTHWAGKKG